jgi:sugar lactone lactonase YvrE
MAIDSEGCLWIAFWDGNAVRRFSPTGEHLLAITTEATRPTSCAFIGVNRQTLAITTAKAPDGTGGDVYTCRPGVAGLVIADYAD